MKRYWPLLLAVFCWFMGLVVPATRHNVWAGWNNWTAYASIIMHDEGGEQAETETVQEWFDRKEMSRWAEEWLQRFPGDKRAQLFAAIEDCGTGKCDELARRYPDDAFIVALQLGSALPRLDAERDDGPISNYAYPEPTGSKYFSAREKWEAFIAIARKGQRLEPQNCFFDVMLLTGLYATRQDDEARRVLKAAARKTIYDPHQREAGQNTRQMLRYVYDMPPPPQQLKLAATSVQSNRTYNLQKVSTWTMDLAVNDRLKGNHQRALDTTLDLLKLCRTMRTSGISMADSRAGFEGEEAALTKLLPNDDYDEPYQLEDGALPVAQYQQYHRSLYRYAKKLHREDIAQLASSEWKDMHSSLPLYDYAKVRRPSAREKLVEHSNTLQFLLLKSSPLVLLLGVIGGWLSWRFGFPQPPGRFYWQGAIAGMGLLALGFVGLLVIDQMDDIFEGNDYFPYYLVRTTRFVMLGFPAILLCLVWCYSGHWQYQQKHPLVSLKTRLKNLTAPPVDGLARFDFGWIFGLILNLTYALLVIASIVVVMFRYDVLSQAFYITGDRLAFWTLALILVPFILARLISWCRLPRKRAALQLGFRVTFQVMSGYLIAASVLYALLVFATLSVNLSFDRQFEQEIQTGELRTLRAEMGH